jgi:dTDP-4-amino-4,6-dideoxygalactose transaminase
MIPFIDLATQQQRIRPQIEKALLKVLDHGAYIMGPEINELETKLSNFSGAKHTLTCSNGTDALDIILMAKNVGPGDAIFVPSFTFAATAEVVAWAGATVIFVDVLKDTFNIDPESLEQGIKVAKDMGLNPCGIIAVDLFGQPADYDSIQDIANKEGLWVLADAAQSFGGSYKGRMVGALAEFSTTSFFPAKPLGCYGDGGAVFTENSDIYEALLSIRIHGQGVDKYQNIRIGMNGRLDTLQAAILLEKLSIFAEEINLRQEVAKRYSEGLVDLVKVPFVRKDCISAWAQYTLQVEPHLRDSIMEGLKAKGIPTVIYYPLPLHRQKAYMAYPCATEYLPVCETLANTVLSLPMHPYLTPEIQDHIIGSLRDIILRSQSKKSA